MTEDILDKLELKNTENLSDNTSENINTLNDNLKINDDITNEDILNYENINKENEIVDEVNLTKEEVAKNTNKNDIKIDQLPVFPNLSE